MPPLPDGIVEPLRGDRFGEVPKGIEVVEPDRDRGCHPNRDLPQAQPMSRVGAGVRGHFDFVAAVRQPDPARLGARGRAIPPRRPRKARHAEAGQHHRTVAQRNLRTPTLVGTCRDHQTDGVDLPYVHPERRIAAPLTRTQPT